MKQTRTKSTIIKELTYRSTGIQNEIEHFLIRLAARCNFNWKEPTHDIARRLMNEISEFEPFKEEGL